jgi:hypothetical protein
MEMNATSLSTLDASRDPFPFLSLTRALTSHVQLYYSTYTATMADLDPSQNGPILADDLMRDRSRQFTEFLDDQACATLLFRGLGINDIDQTRVQLPRVD